MLFYLISYIINYSVIKHTHFTREFTGKNNEDDLNTENLEIEVGQGLANTLLPIKCHSIFGPCS